MNVVVNKKDSSIFGIYINIISRHGFMRINIKLPGFTHSCFVVAVRCVPHQFSFRKVAFNTMHVLQMFFFFFNFPFIGCCTNLLKCMIKCRRFVKRSTIISSRKTGILPHRPRIYAEVLGKPGSRDRPAKLGNQILKNCNSERAIALEPKYRCLWQELRLIREQGYAVSQGEIDEGVWGISVPLLDSRQRLHGALSLMAPALRAQSRSERLRQWTLDAAARLSARLD